MRYVWSEKSRIQRQISHTSIVVLLDYDGTISPIVETPTTAVLTASAKVLLRKLSVKKHIKVCIVSGRSLADIRERVGIDTIDYAGIHGYESDIHATPFMPQHMQNVLSEIKHVLAHLPSLYSGIILEDKIISIAIHYRMVSASTVPKFLKQVSRMIAPYKEKYGIVIKKGKKVLELFADAEWNKGKFVKMYLQKIRARSSRYKTVIYIGDDTTDEDAFTQLSSDITIHVGKNRSKARYWVSDVSEVLVFLSWMTQIIG